MLSLQESFVFLCILVCFSTTFLFSFVLLHLLLYAVIFFLCSLKSEYQKWQRHEREHIYESQSQQLDIHLLICHKAWLACVFLNVFYVCKLLLVSNFSVQPLDEYFY